MTHWAAQFVGRPWTPEFNCWALVREVVALHWGHDLPPLAVGLEDSQFVPIMQAASVAGWRPADGPPRDGDIAVGRLLSGKRHVGVMIDTRKGLQMLHSDSSTTAAVVQPLRETGLVEVEFWRPYATR